MKIANITHMTPQIPTIQITTLDHVSILDSIWKQCLSFPKMFLNSPIIIDFSKLVENNEIPPQTNVIVKLAEELISGFKKFKLLPIGIIGLDYKHCEELGVSSFSPENKEKEKEKQDASTEPRTDNNCDHTKIIKGDFRSGMTIFEKNSNLVIIGDVKRGSEVAAGGNIIIFGKLFGKAHAGCTFKNSVVTTLDLDPEIVSIGGVFLPNQSFGEKDLNKTAIITIDEECKLVVSSY